MEVDEAPRAATIPLLEKLAKKPQALQIQNLRSKPAPLPVIRFSPANPESPVYLLHQQQADHLMSKG